MSASAVDHPLVPPERLLFLIDRIDHANAGTEGQLAQLIRGLSARGTQCHLAVLSASEYVANGGLPCDWTVLGHTSLASPRTWWAMYRLGRRLRRRGFELAHTFFNDVSALAPPALAGAGIRTIISRRDMGFWYTPGYLRLLRQTGRWAAGCVTNSQAVADLTMRCERLPRERVHVIYNGLASDATMADEAVPELEALQRQGRVLCGVVANVRPIKRLGDLVAALARLADELPELDVVFIGSGDTSGLREQAERLGVASRVHCLGQRTDVTACLRHLDIGVLCSESEGFSNAVVEYMLAGLPTVCTRAGGNPEAVTHGRTGFLYPVGDVEALAGALRTLAADADLRQSLGARAAEAARARFAVERMVDDHIAVYRRVAGAQEAV